MTSSMGFDRSWGAVVVDFPDGPQEECLFLLVKLASGNHWDSPKGHPEGPESPRETARREIREEGGVEVKFVGDFLSEAEWTLPSGRLKKVGYFLAEKTGESPTGGPEDEILDLVWLPFKEARDLATYESGKAVLDAAVKSLKSE